MSRLGCKMILTARTEAKAQDLLKEFPKETDCRIVDFEDLHASVAFAMSIASAGKLPDLILLNHGLQCNEKIITQENFEKSFQVNFISQLLVIETWYKSGIFYRESKFKIKIGFVSSGMHKLVDAVRWDDLDFEAREYTFKDAYCQSKLFQLLYMQILVQKCPQVTWFATEPGPVKSNIYRPESGFVEPPWKGFEDRPTPDQGSYPGVFALVNDIQSGAFLKVPDGSAGELSPLVVDERNQEMLKVMIEDVCTTYSVCK